ncbi:MAG: hypothetical protein KAJ19_11400 [Gammaproteobacteria bacterium]|nr:hypothetical protein [Gammaproteobacteria bacterium]
MHIHHKAEKPGELTFGELEVGEAYYYSDVPEIVNLKSADGGRVCINDGSSVGFVRPDSPVKRAPGFFYPCTPEQLEAVKSGKLEVRLVEKGEDVA